MKRIFYDWEFDESPGCLLPISLGMVDEDGNAMYLINRDADLESCNEWVKRHVVPNLGDGIPVSLVEMAHRVEAFTNCRAQEVRLYGYYCAYDHVALARLFGTMEQMPLPYYTTDIRVLMDVFGVDVGTSGNRHNALEDAIWTRKAFLEIESAVKKQLAFGVII